MFADLGVEHTPLCGWYRNVFENTIDPTEHALEH